jgi:hypothetical protein
MHKFCKPRVADVYSGVLTAGGMTVKALKN